MNTYEGYGISGGAKSEDVGGKHEVSERLP